MSSDSFRPISFWVLAIPFLAMSCTVLPAQKDTTQFFILTSAHANDSSQSPTNASRREMAVGLGPINFPGYLKRREVVTQVETGELQLSDNQRWAESLDSNFQRVLSQDLGNQLGDQRIILFPWYGQPQIDYQVEVQVHRFDMDTSHQTHLSARWIIKDPRNGRELVARESNISSSVAAGDTAGSQALSNDVNTLSSSIAQSLLGLNEAGARPVQMRDSRPDTLGER